MSGSFHSGRRWLNTLGLGCLLAMAAPEVLAESAADAQMAPRAAAALPHQPRPGVPPLVLLVSVLAAAGLGAYAMHRRRPAGAPGAVEEQRAPSEPADTAPLQAELAQLQSLVENSSDIISRQDADGRLLFVSAACRRVLGYEPEAMVGRPIFDFFHPDEVFRSKRMFESAARQGGEHVSTYRVRGADGSYVWLEATSHILPRPDGEGAAEMVTVCRNISGRDAQQQSLRQNEALYRRAFEEAAVPATLTGARTGQFLRVNTAFCLLLGYSRAELREINAQQVIHPGDWPLILEAARTSLAGKNEVIRLPCGFLRKDGSTVATEAAITLLWDDGGRPLYFICQMLPRLGEPGATPP